MKTTKRARARKPSSENVQLINLLKGAASALEHGRHMTATRKLKQIDALIVTTILDKEPRELSQLRQTDEALDVQDRALNTAEEILKELLPIADHVNVHLGEELTNIKMHGHRNDDPQDPPEAIWPEDGK